VHELIEFTRTNIGCAMACERPQHEVWSDMSSVFLILLKVDNSSKAPEGVVIRTSHILWDA